MGTRVTGLAAGVPVGADYLPYVDVSDTSMAATGTTKKVLAANLEYYAQTPEELSAAVTPTDYSYAPGDLRRYGGVDGASFISALTTANSIDAPIFVAQDYTVDMTGVTVGITIPATGLHLVGINSPKLTFTDNASGELFAGVAATSGGTIRIEGIWFSATVSNDRVTVIDFEGDCFFDEMIVRFNTFEGKSRFLWNNASGTDPTGEGITRFSARFNTLLNPDSRFINFTNVPTEFAEFSDNQIRNIGSAAFYWTNQGAAIYGEPIEMLSVMRNDIYCDDDFWSDDPEGSYISPIVLQGYACDVGYNSIYGLKSTLDDIDFQPFYLTCRFVQCHNNTVRNCGKSGAVSGDVTIFHCKGHPNSDTKVGYAVFDNNSYIVDRGYFESLTPVVTPKWTMYKASPNRDMTIINNYIDVPELYTSGDTNTAAVCEAFRFNGNTVIVRDELLNTSVMRFEQNSDDATDDFHINDNVFDIAEKSTNDAVFLRVTTNGHTRGDGDDNFPAPIQFNNNRIRLRGNWDRIFESGGPWYTLNGKNNYIEVDDVIDRVFSASTLMKDFQCEFRFRSPSGAVQMLPPNDAPYYDEECDIDLTYRGVSLATNHDLPLSTDVLSATTAHVFVDYECMQTGGDYSHGVFDYTLADDGAGNLDVSFTSSSSTVTAQIPDTTEQDGSGVDIDTSLVRGTDLMTGVTLNNNNSPLPAYFTGLPSGEYTRIRIRKTDV